MTSVAISRAGVPIRLTDERWTHIVAAHPEVIARREETLLAISAAERVVAGSDGAAMAIRRVAPRKSLVVVYRELAMLDGFVITAFLTSRRAALDRRLQLWPPGN